MFYYWTYEDQIKSIAVETIFTSFGLIIEFYESFSLYKAYKQGISGELMNPVVQGKQINLETTEQAEGIQSDAVKAAHLLELQAVPTRDFRYNRDSKLPKHFDIKIIDYTATVEV